jgi:hypothetical protein
VITWDLEPGIWDFPGTAVLDPSFLLAPTAYIETIGPL